MDKNELLQFNHTNIQELIRFIDQKAGALLVIYGFLLTATIEFAKDLKFINPFALNNFFKSLISISTLIVGLFLIGLLIFQVFIILFEVIKPRTASNYTQDEKSVIYFKHISQQTKQEFNDRFKEISNEDIQKEMIEQVYEIACIMSQKSEKFNSLLKWLFTSIFLLLFYIFLTNLL